MIRPMESVPKLEARDRVPLRLTLWCPMCSCQHVDRGKFERVPHKTHKCEYCDHEWRPFSFYTVGRPRKVGRTSSEYSDAWAISDTPQRSEARERLRSAELSTLRAVLMYRLRRAISEDMQERCYTIDDIARQLWDPLFLFVEI